MSFNYRIDRDFHGAKESHPFNERIPYEKTHNQGPKKPNSQPPSKTKINTDLKNAKTAQDLCRVIQSNLDQFDHIHTSISFNRLAKFVKIDKKSPRNSINEELLLKMQAKAIAILGDFSLQSIATLLNALNSLKIENKILFYKAIENLETKNLKDFATQNLSNIAASFVKHEVRNQPFLKKIAEEAMKRSFEDFKPRDLATLFWAFGEHKVYHQELFERFADKIELGQLSHKFNLQDFCNITRAFIGFETKRPLLFKTIGKEIIEKKLLNDAPAIGLSEIPWNFAKAGIKDSVLFREIAHKLMDMPLHKYSFEFLKEILWSFSRLGESAHDSLFSKITEEMARKSLKEVEIHILSIAVRSCVELEMYQSPLITKLKKELVERSFDNCSPNCLGNMAWSFKRLGRKSEHKQIFDKIAEEMLERQSLSDFSPKQFSIILWAFSDSKEVQHRPFFDKMARELEGRSLDKFDIDDFKMILLAFSSVERGKYRSLFEKIAEEIETRSLENFTSADFSLILKELSKSNVWNISLFNKIAEEIMQRSLYDFPESCLSSIIRSFATAQIDNVHLYDTLSYEIMQRPLNKFSSPELADMLYADAKFPRKDDSFFKRIAEEITKRSIDSFKENHLLDILWSFVTRRVYNPAFFQKIVEEIVRRPLDGYSTTMLVHATNIFVMLRTQNMHNFNATLKEIEEKTSLDESKLDALANIASFSEKLNEKAKIFFGKIEKKAEELSFKKLTPNNLELIIKNFAIFKIEAVALFDKIAKELMERSFDKFEIENLAFIAWAFATLEIENRPLFNKIVKKVTEIPLSRFNPKDLITMASAFIKADVQEKSLLEAMAKELIGKDLTRFTEEQLARTAWIFERLQIRHNVFLNRMAQEIKTRSPHDFSMNNLAEMIVSFAKLESEQDLIFDILIPWLSYKTKRIEGVRKDN